jgi:hypothetical protein
MKNQGTRAADLPTGEAVENDSNTMVAMRSGFIARASDGLSDNPSATNQEYGWARNSGDFIIVPYRRKVDPGVYSLVVEELMKEYGSDNSVLNSPFFIKKMILAGSQLWGKSGFRAWVSIQSHSPYITQQHLDFIADTVSYIGGSRRRYTTNWSIMALQKGEEKTARNNVKPLYDKLVSSNQLLPDSKMITMWLSRPDGALDFLNSLVIMFGSRNASIVGG